MYNIAYTKEILTKFEVDTLLMMLHDLVTMTFDLLNLVM